MKKSVFYFAYNHRYMLDKEQGKNVLPHIEQIIKYIKADGLDAVELFPTDQLSYDRLDYVKRYKEFMDSEGVKCSCFSFGTPILFDPKAATETLKKCVDLAKILGSPFLHHTFHSRYVSSKQPESESIYENVEGVFADVAKEVAYYAGEQGLQCIYEDQGYFMNSVERLGSLLAKIDLPNTGVCLDVGNSFYCDIPAEYYAGAFASVVKHVHIKDYLIMKNAEITENDFEYSITKTPIVPCLPGTGSVSFEKIFKILLSVGYDGYFSLEHQGHRTGYTYERADKMIGEALSNVEKIYNRVKG